jgi:hypothetical protein
MAVLFIAEYEHLATDRSAGGSSNIAQDPPIAEQTEAITGASTQSNAFNGNTKFIRVHTDSICSIAVGADPTASATTRRMAAGQTEYFGVRGGWKIAVISNS